MELKRSKINYDSRICLHFFMVLFIIKFASSFLAGSTARARAELHVRTADGPRRTVPHRPRGPGDVESTDRDYSESLVRTWLSLCPLMLRHRDRDRLGHGCESVRPAEMMCHGSGRNVRINWLWLLWGPGENVLLHPLLHQRNIFELGIKVS